MPPAPLSVTSLVVTATLAVATLNTPVMHRFKEEHWRRERAVGAEALRGAAPPADEFYNQTLDHFNVLTGEFWRQRFWVNDTFYKGVGPLFLYVEGEGAGSPYSVVSGQHVELAAAHGALLISLEHRFYGASIPTKDLSTDALGYLSSHQAVGDVARFLGEYVPTRWPGVSRTVTFGGSYPGALSAWLRLRLPHLIFAAFSTSSPVQAIVDFTGYCDTVSYAVSSALVGGSPACLTALRAAFADIDTAFRGNASAKTVMSTKMHSCDAALSDDDVMWAVSNLASYVMGLVQYNNPARAPNVGSFCAAMTAPGVAPVDAFGALIGASVGAGGCMDNSYADFVATLSDTTAHPEAGGVGIRQWTWQTCSQFAYYQSCEPATSNCPFSSLMTLASSFQQCTDGFDDRVRESVNRAAVDDTNALLGAKAVANATSRVLWANGGIDPWHTLSALAADIAPFAGSAAVFMPASSHCRAMSASRADDPQEVKDARAQSAAALAGWLAAA